LSRIRFTVELSLTCVAHIDFLRARLRAERFRLSFQTRVCGMPFGSRQFHHKFSIQLANLLVDCQIFSPNQAAAREKSVWCNTPSSSYPKISMSITAVSCLQ